MLIQHGARVDYELEDGSTILHSVVDRTRREMGTVERLSRRSIGFIEGISHNDLRSLDLDVKGSCGYTAFDILVMRTRLLRKERRKVDCNSGSLNPHLPFADYLRLETITDEKEEDMYRGRALDERTQSPPSLRSFTPTDPRGARCFT